jgi:hypothetical protein
MAGSSPNCSRRLDSVPGNEGVRVSFFKLISKNMPRPGKPPEKQWMDDYAVLSQADRDNPISTLWEISTRDYLFHQRNQLFEFYEAGTQSAAWEDDDPDMKSHRLFFYKTTLLLWEIGFRIVEMIEKKEILYSYVSKGGL